MTRLNTIIALGCIALLVPVALIAGESFSWAPVTAADWALGPDSVKGIRNAIMIFSRLTRDDENFMGKECYYTVYNRIRIFDAGGRKWGDVEVDVFEVDQEVEVILGRTLLPDGREIPLTKAEIHEKEVFKTEGVKVMQKSFSLPGMVDGCIIEYYVKYRLEHSPSVWLIQKEIAVQEAEYRWKFYDGQGTASTFYNMFRDEFTPNYLWLNCKDPGTVEQLPNIKEPEEIRFTIRDIPAFEAEPHSLSRATLLSQLRLYYGKSSAPGAYWGDLSQSITRGLENFTAEDDDLEKIITTFGVQDSVGKKIRSAYDWVQANIRNVDYVKGKKDFENNETVNDVLDRRYGDNSDINAVFYDMLREMGVDAKLVYVLDRTEGLLVTDAKYWQFDGTLVAVKSAQGAYEYYSPADIHLQFRHIPRFVEGTLAMLVGDQSQQFVTLPFSPAEANREQRSFVVAPTAEFTLAGSLTALSRGHAARRLRIIAHELTPAEIAQELKEEAEEDFPDAEIDSIGAAGLDGAGNTVTLTGRIKLPDTQQRVGDRIILQPFSFMSGVDNPFHKEERLLPILLDYAHEIFESMVIAVPEGYSVESVPPDTSFGNSAGKCEMKFARFEGTLSIQRVFRLNTPFWPATSYGIVRELYRSRQEFDVLTVVFKKQ
ncbi:MAG TPA: transglutaminase domain-containing protein [Bacteroidota bacterium]|nr:transglutaminase domain-containing protein [Bacteroidota bacterium]